MTYSLEYFSFNFIVLFNVNFIFWPKEKKRQANTYLFNLRVRDSINVNEFWGSVMKRISLKEKTEWSTCSHKYLWWKAFSHLEIKLQTSSFTPRRVQLILHLNFKGVPVSLCGAWMERQRLRPAGFADLIKFPPTGYTYYPCKHN